MRLRDVTGRVRDAGSTAALRALCLVTGGAPRVVDGVRMHRSRVLSGPLRGKTMSMPTLERLSFALGTYEPHVARAISEYVRPDAVAYDVGANAGYLSMLMASRAGPAGSVFSFEPDRRNAAALRENLRANNFPTVTIIPSAVSDTSGHLTFATFRYSLVGQIATAATASDAVMVDVPCTTLDDFIYGQGHAAPQFIKIDVEGAEERVFAGGGRTLREARPVIVAEIRSAVWPAIERMTRDCGYTSRPLAGKDYWAAEYGVNDLLLLPPQ